MVNNTAGREICPFAIGCKNWVTISSIAGTQVSAVIYSIVETAKANGLDVYQYFDLLFTELPKHLEDKDTRFLAELLPWSDAVQKQCHAVKKA